MKNTTNLRDEYWRISENGCNPPKKMRKNFSKESIFKPNYYCLECKGGNVERIFKCGIERWCRLCSGKKYTIDHEKIVEEKGEEK
jgi:hypothetical protein